ncbi:MAG TPA: triple tyrosine motif-containing protein, partial [Clostridiales bacterium]|nr:triple tyrosine motif-containing protein [Clostridiales bacterium]
YNLQVRAKGAGAGSYEIARSIEVNVLDNQDEKADITSITLNDTYIEENAQPRKPILLRADATATNGNDLLYKFYVYDKDLRTQQLKGYSIDQTCVWKPRKPGVYTISVLVKNQASFGKYDAIESFEITVS